MLQVAGEHLRPHDLERVTAVGEAPGHRVQPPFHVVVDAGEGEAPLLVVLLLVVGELKDRVDDLAALAAHRVGEHPRSYADLRRGEPGALRTLLLTCPLSSGFLGFGSLDVLPTSWRGGLAVVPGAWRCGRGRVSVRWSNRAASGGYSGTRGGPGRGSAGRAGRGRCQGVAPKTPGPASGRRTRKRAGKGGPAGGSVPVG